MRSPSVVLSSELTIASRMRSQTGRVSQPSISGHVCSVMSSDTHSIGATGPSMTR